MHPSSSLVCLILCLAAAPTPGADQFPGVGATVPSDPLFRALLVDGTIVSGRIAQIGPEGTVVLVDGGEHKLPLRRVVKLTRAAEVPTPADGPIVLFPEGDRLRGAINGSGETDLDLVPTAVGDAPALAVPLDATIGLILAPPAEEEASEALLARVRSEFRAGDALWLANGDRLAGSFVGLDARKVRFQPEAGPAEVDRAGVVAVGLDPAAARYPRPEGDYLELTLVDGSRLGVSGAHVEQGQVVARTRFGAPLRVALTELARIHVRGDAITYLSEREADAAQSQAYLADPRPYRRDANVEGRPLRLGGQTFDRGLGTQSRTLLAYKLDGRASRFQATVGLDDRAGPLGSVVFRVLVDRQERFKSPPMTARDAPRAVDVELAGAGTLILATEFGDRGEIRDLADWAEARLVR